MSDHDAYKLHPKDRIWYNKFFVATTLNYNAGIDRIPKTGRYVVRPIINLDGCGLGARIGNYKKGQIIPFDYFWSEVFVGRHITIDYVKVNNAWQQSHTFEGFKTDPENLLQFSHWQRVNYQYKLPAIFDTIQADKLNIEIIGDKIIEVHLRHSTDPVDYDFFIPIWSEYQPCPQGFTRIKDTTDFPGRLGFFVEQAK